jgi:hypothetical protein
VRSAHRAAPSRAAHASPGAINNGVTTTNPAKPCSVGCQASVWRQPAPVITMRRCSWSVGGGAATASGNGELRALSQAAQGGFCAARSAATAQTRRAAIATTTPSQTSRLAGRAFIHPRERTARDKLPA